MRNYTLLWILAWLVVFTFCEGVCYSQRSVKQSHRIDRQSLVSRHNITITSFDSLSSLTVGNGNFAFTVDPTGLQTFPDFYKNGVPLGTQSQWGWHSFPNPEHYSLEDVTKDYQVAGREIPYVTSLFSTNREREATKWLRENPHRLDLGTVGWILKNGTAFNSLKGDEIKDIHQTLNLWKGEINSNFSLNGEGVKVKTISNQSSDGFLVKAKSPLFRSAELGIKVKFSYGSGNPYEAGDWNSPQKHQTIIMDSCSNGILIKRILDSTVYYVHLSWKGKVQVTQIRKHEIEIFPDSDDPEFIFSISFSNKEILLPGKDYKDIASENERTWKEFWESGGAVDFSGSTDSRANELERRIILSQYLTRVQDAGNYPPQETGLTYNSWYGKFHLEMHFWHEAQFALWKRESLLEKSLPWYFRVAEMGRRTAEKQGYRGVRWPKMTDTTGRESPSPIGPFLIWQEPHIIFMSELIYRNHPNKKTIDKFKDLVFGTADFMASYPGFDSLSDRYILGPALIPAQETYRPDQTINPTFELAYWYWGLSVAQEWRLRSGLEREPKWDSVMNKLSNLPAKDGVYLGTESAPDTYSNPAFITDHPSMLMGYGLLPKTQMVDTVLMNNTLDKVLKVWNWEGTWGWDYPVVAMTATRLGRPQDAVNSLLMNVTKNTFLVNGHNYQGKALRLYLPGNGSLLYAVAMMCAGWDGYQGPPAPGFPKDGKWVVRWENLSQVP